MTAISSTPNIFERLNTKISTYLILTLYSLIQHQSKENNQTNTQLHKATFVACQNWISNTLGNGNKTARPKSQLIAYPKICSAIERNSHQTFRQSLKQFLFFGDAKWKNCTFLTEHLSFFRPLHTAHRRRFSSLTGQQAIWLIRTSALINQNKSWWWWRRGARSCWSTPHSCCSNLNQALSNQTLKLAKLDNKLNFLNFLMLNNIFQQIKGNKAPKVKWHVCRGILVRCNLFTLKVHIRQLKAFLSPSVCCCSMIWLHLQAKSSANDIGCLGQKIHHHYFHVVDTINQNRYQLHVAPILALQ